MNKYTYNKIIQSSFALLTGTIVASLINYGFTIAMARILTPNDYATLVTLISIIMIISTPLRTATIVAAKYTSYVLERYNAYAQIMLVIGIGIAGLYIGISLPLTRLLTIPIQAFLVLAPIIVLLPLLSMNVGLLQGMKYIGTFAWIPALEALIKFIFSLLLTGIGYKTYGAIGAISIAIATSCIFNTAIIARAYRVLVRQHKVSSTIPNKWPQGVLVILASNTTVALLGNMDILAAKHFFTSEMAAQYSVLIVLSRILSYGSLIMIPILFPAMSQATRKTEVRELFQKGMYIAIGIAISILIVFICIPEYIIDTLPGQHYRNIAPYLVYAGLASSLWSFSQIFIFYFLATNIKRFLMPLLAITVVQASVIYIHHESIRNILITMNCIQIILLYIFYLIFRSEKRT